MDKMIAEKKGEPNKSQWTLEDLRKLVRDQEENRPIAETKKTMATPPKPLPAPLLAVAEKTPIQNIQPQQMEKPESATHSLIFWTLLLALPLMLLLGFLIWKMTHTE